MKRYLLFLLLIPLINVKAMSVEVDGETYNDLILASASVVDNSNIVFHCSEDEECQMEISDVNNITVDINGSYVADIIGDFSGTITDSLETGSIGALYLGSNNSNNKEININKVNYIDEVSVYQNMKANFTTDMIIDSFYNYGKSNIDIFFINIFNNFNEAVLKLARPSNGFHDIINRTIPGSKDVAVTNNGGNLTIKDGYYYYVSNKCYDNKTPETIIEDGAFNSPKTLRNYCGDLKVLEGDFKGDILLEQKEDSNKDVNTIIDGGSFNLEAGLFNIKDGSVIINGGAFKSNGKTSDINYSIYLDSNSSLTFNKGTITLDENGLNDGILVKGTFNFGDKDIKVSKNNQLLYLNDNKLDFTKGRFNFYNGSIYLDNKIDDLKSGVKNYVLYYEELDNNKLRAYLKPLSNNAEDKNICKRIDDKFYDKNGKVVSKAEYEKSCPEEVPDTGIIIPIISTLILAIIYTIFTILKRKKYLNKI